MSAAILTARGLVVLLSCWPVVHIIASKQDLISPWKFGGYAMYSVPTTRLDLHISECSNADDLLEVQSSKEFVRLRKDFLRRQQTAQLRNTLLYTAIHSDSLSKLSHWVFSRDPEIECITLTVSEQTLSQTTGRWNKRRYSYEATRRDPLALQGAVESVEIVPLEPFAPVREVK